MYVVMFNIFDYNMTVNEVFIIACCSFIVHLTEYTLDIRKLIKEGLL